MRQFSLMLALLSLLSMSCQQNPILPTSGDENNTSVTDNDINEPSAAPVFQARHEVTTGSTVFTLLKTAGISVMDIHDVERVAKPIVDLRNVRKGSAFVISWRDSSQKELTQVEYVASQVKSFIFRKLADDEWTAESIEKPVEVRKVTFVGNVKSNLWESAENAGMDTSLIGSLAEIFAWQIDFARAVRQGDQWRLTVEQKFVDGQFFAWGNILAAEYKNGEDVYTGVRFPQTGPHASYYFPDGSSLKRMFLKSPIKFARITSRFTNSRFHPIYKRNQAHNGVDYAAPPGTPIMSVGNGVVAFVGRKGSAGNMIRIRHNGTYQTAYCHLSAYAKGLRQGDRVNQGEVIGYVGSTGAATGPHLHFAFYENDTFVDPLGRKFPSADPVASAVLPEFKNAVSVAMNFLPDWQLAENSRGKLPPTAE